MEAKSAIVIAGILLAAWLVLFVVRRVIGHTVAGLQGDRVRQGLHLLRRRAPAGLLDVNAGIAARRLQRATTIGALLRSASTVIVVVVTALLVLDQLTVDLAPFVAGTAIATAALGFGAQNIVRDFLAGFFIVVEDQYGVGDFIDAGEAKGTVEYVSLRTTRIRGSDGTLWHVPNGEIKRVGNKSQAWSRAIIEFRVDLRTPIPLAIGTLKTAADALASEDGFSSSILHEPEVWGPEEVTADGILLKLVVTTKPLEQWRIARALRTRIKEALDREGIAIAPVPEA